MGIIEILKKLKEQGVYVELENNNLILKSTTKKIDSELLGILKKEKSNIVSYLRKYKGKDSNTLKIKIKPYNRSTFNNIPLSFNQERLWFIDQLQGSKVYHIPFIYHLSGNLNIELFESSLREIIKRHEALRTVIYSNEGIGYQKLLPINEWSVDYQLFENNENSVKKYLEKFISDPFYLEKDYMFRSCLLDLGNDKYIWAGVLHHISSDGWSIGTLMNEFVKLYNSSKEKDSTSLPPLPLQYIDYAIWQRKNFKEQIIEKQLSYWEEKLVNVPVLQLNNDYSRPPVKSIKGSSVTFNLDYELSTSIKALSLNENVTVFMTLLASFKVLLCNYSGQNDICVGTSIANRNGYDLDKIIGFFANTIALRNYLKTYESFIEFLQNIKTTTLSAFENQEAPFEKVVERVIKTRDLSITPLFQVMFVLQNNSNPKAIKLNGLEVSNYDELKHTTSQFDLTMVVNEDDSKFSCTIEYCVDLFSKDTMYRMADHYQQLLKSIIYAPHKAINSYSILTPNESHQILNVFNHSIKDGSTNNSSIIELFERQVNKKSNAIAIVYESEEISYKELDKKSDQLAHYLKECGVEKENLVGICLDRSPWMIVSILAIIKAGGAYVPIDPDLPQERISHILLDTRVKKLITNTNTVKLNGYLNDFELVLLDREWIEIEKKLYQKLNSNLSQGSLLYVLYTSGSTGKPKGVMIEQGGIINLVNSQVKTYNFFENEAVLQFSNYCFDASVEQIFLALLSGSKLVLASKGDIMDVIRLEKLILREEVTHLDSVPSYLEHLSIKNLISNNSSLRRVVSGGESCSFKLINNFTQMCDFYNAYGPTENSVTSTVYKYSKKQTNLFNKQIIGSPIPNTQAYIMNEKNNLLPIGISGELTLGGIGLARGYLNAEKLTNEKFINNPFKEGERLYKTGDLARWLPDGNIEFIGRKDSQVKIRGYRIELNEVKNALLSVSEIAQCTVLTKEDSRGDKQLVSYVVWSVDCDKKEIQDKLRQKLPEYMIPKIWIELQEMPTTNNGKIDTKFLLNMELPEVSTSTYEPPKDEMEERLVLIWQKLLGVEKIGINEDFFELGGHSILAIKLVGEISILSSRRIDVSDVFECPTIRLLSERIFSNRIVENEILYKLNAKGSKRPIFFAHPVSGEIYSYYQLVRVLGDEYPVYAFRAPGFEKRPVLESIEQMAATYIAEIQKIDPKGPYFLGGYSFGGKIALEMALQLQSKGFEVSELLILDTFAPIKGNTGIYEKATFKHAVSETFKGYSQRFDKQKNLEISLLKDKSKKEQIDVLYAAIQSENIPIMRTSVRNTLEIYVNNTLFDATYLPIVNKKLDTKVILFQSQELFDKSKSNGFGWEKLTKHKVETHLTSKYHKDLTTLKNVKQIAKVIRNYIE